MGIPRPALVVSALALPLLGLLAWRTADEAVFGLRARRVEIRIDEGSANALLLDAAIGYKAYTISYTYTIDGQILRGSERVSRPMPRVTKTWVVPSRPGDCRMGWMDDLALYGVLLVVGGLAYGMGLRHLLRKAD